MRFCLLAVAIAIVAPAGFAAPADTTSTAAGAEKLNVLFIAVDDLRPELGCYGSDLAHSPNIDKLAARSLTFNRAYCQYPVCNPSRASLMTGLRPDTTRVYDLEKSFRETDPDTLTIPQLFKQHGYYARSIGKIYHGATGPLCDPESWSEAPVGGKDRAPTAEGKKRQRHGMPYESPDVADDQLPDGDAADMAIAALRENRDRPFFLALGMAKPHLPFVAPQRYWERYNETSVPLAEYQKLPEGAPPFATNDSGELRQYETIPKRPEPIPDSQEERLKAGYLACVSYMDAQVGRVLDELDRLGLRKKTVIVLWGDHGYQLGEHGTWTKHNTWELSSRVPLILTDPAGAAAGKKTDALVELVDLYPTLAEMCGLQPPPGLEGTSLVPLLKNPDRSWKTAAFTLHRKGIKDMGRVLADSIRTDRYRFIEWSPLNEGTKDAPPVDYSVTTQSLVKTGKLIRDRADFKAYELYDHQTDPQETKNLANLPEYKDIVEQLKQQLHAGWKAARPEED